MLVHLFFINCLIEKQKNRLVDITPITLELL
jgi:hypothetical protein